MASPADVINQNTPTLLSVAIAAAILAGTVGFFVGQLTSLGTVSSTRIPEKDIHEDSASSIDDVDTSAGKKHDKGSSLNEWPRDEEYKLVLVVRTDLGMTKGNHITYRTWFYKDERSNYYVYSGKIAAQCGHATLACYKSSLPQKSGKSSRTAAALKQWEHMGQAKIAVQCRSEDDLLMYQAQAISLGLVAEVIYDAGRTQIAANSATVLGIGPGPKSVIDQVTGTLKLL